MNRFNFYYIRNPSGVYGAIIFLAFLCSVRGRDKFITVQWAAELFLIVSPLI